MTPRPLLRVAAAAAALAVAALLTAATPTPTPTPTPTLAPVKHPVADDLNDPVRAAEYWLDMTSVREAWQVTRGKGVTIAVIDTGIGDVPATFDEAVIGGTDVSGGGASDGRTPLGVIDGNHGSWVASLAAGRGSADGTGMIGVAPEANLLSISVGFTVPVPVSFTEQVANAMKWAVDNGADIINLSFTTNTLDWDESWDEAFLYAHKNDVVVIVAAGNRASGTAIVGAPATIPGVLTVAGVDQAGKASRQASTQGITIGISAPSEELLGVSADGSVATWNGTSGAAPIVAGIAALVRSANPELDANNVINRLIKTAKPDSSVTSVPDPLYGFGLVDAAAAVNTAVPLVKANPMGDLSEWVRLFRRANAEPAPVPTVIPREVAALEPPEGPSEANSPFLPSVESLRYGTIPLVAVTVPGILIGLGVTAAARLIRLARARRTPSSY